MIEDIRGSRVLYYKKCSFCKWAVPKDLVSDENHCPVCSKKYRRCYGDNFFIRHIHSVNIYSLGLNKEPKEKLFPYAKVSAEKLNEIIEEFEIWRGIQLL